MPDYRIELMRAQRLDAHRSHGTSGHAASVKLLRAAGQFRYINGWITSVELGGAVGNFDTYHVALQPWLWHLTLGADCRIFQDKNGVRSSRRFSGLRGVQVDKSKLTGTPRSRPYCVQYRESDFDFVSRLMEEEGI